VTAGAIRARDLHGVSETPIWPGLVYFSLLACSVHLVGLIVDINSDILNRKLPYLASRIVSPRQVMLGAAVLVAASAVMLPRLDAAVSVFGLVGYLMGLIYVVPPVRLKGRPPFDLLLHMFGYGTLLFAVGWFSQTDVIHSYLLVSSVPYAAAVGFIYVLTARIDLAGDAATGTSTIASWGSGTCEVLGSLLLLTSILSAAFVEDLVVLPAGILVLLAFVLSRFLGGHLSHIRICKIAVVGLALAVSANYPPLLIPLILSLLLTRLYHTRRLEIVYP
jgi:4-hydroxybenzoate polyprenyltransferase